MAMGHPYTYERVLRDSDKYPKVLENGKYLRAKSTFEADASD